VLDDLKGKSVFDLNAALATEYAKKRAAKPMKPAELRKEVARLIGQPDTVPVFQFAAAGEIKRDKYKITKCVFSAASGVPVPGLAFEPADAKPAPVVVLVSDQGSAACEGHAAQLATAGRHALAVDLRGYGETAPGVAKDVKGPTFGVDYKEAFLGFHLRQPMLAQRTADLLGAINVFAPRECAVEIHGFGSAGPVVLHAAALTPRVQAVTIDGGLVSWENVLRTPINHNQLANVIPGALAVYDLPDLAAAVAPRALTIRNPVDAAGKPLTKDAAEEAYKQVRDAYKKADAADKFTLVIDAK
jgi:pimeloyl-ACP methyl ester carboxylesterase